MEEDGDSEDNGVGEGEEDEQERLQYASTRSSHGCVEKTSVDPPLCMSIEFGPSGGKVSCRGKCTK